jgi:type II secretory pathway pseudopilin PulG
MQRLLAFWPLGLLLFLGLAILIPLFTPIVDLKITQAQFDLNAIDTALHIYRTQHGDFPSEAEGLSTLAGNGGPLARLPVDPWGNAYRYRRAVGSSSYLIYSPGLDHRDDVGLGDDVILGPKAYRCADYGVNCPPDPTHVLAWSAVALAGLSMAAGVARGAIYLAHALRRSNHRWSGRES